MKQSNTQQPSQQAATSINPILDRLRSKWKEADCQARKIRFAIPYSYDEFLSLISAHANIIIRERRERNIFEIDKVNEPILRVLHNYSTLSKSFEVSDLSLEKGIMLTGAFGCGKSIIMEAYSRIISEYADEKYLPKMKFIKSIQLFNELKAGMKYEKLPVVIDEFGREKKEGRNYGEEIQPVIDWLSIRYDLGSLTHGTSNFKIETLESDEFYGKMIGDRLKSMFNFIVLPGQSRRK